MIPISIRKFLQSALMAGISAMLVVGCGGKPVEQMGPRFAYVTNGVASFWTVAAAGAKQAGKDMGVEVTVVMPNGLTDQTRKLEDLLSRGIDGVAISPINSEHQTDILNKVAAETILITQDSDAPDSDRQLYIGMDNYQAGLMCGQLVRDALPDGGSVMLFIGRLDQDNAQYRRQGCIDAILGREPDRTRRDPPGASPSSDDGKYQVLGTLTDEFDMAKAKANVEDTLTRHPDVAAMVGLFVFNPPAILEALERAGKLGEVKVIGFDEDDATLAGIREGTVVGTVVQDPFRYGYQSIEMLVRLYRDDHSTIPESRYIDVPPRLIDKQNVDDVWATLKKQLASDTSGEP